MRRRLLAFGCSFTYGHGLADCVNDEDGPGPRPSQFAWPRLLADKVDAQCVNLGQPGASNKEIWNNIVNADFTSRDIVVVLWTYPARWAIVTESGVETVYPWETSKRSKTFYKTMYDEHDSRLDLNLRMHHAYLMLRSLQIPSYHCILDSKDYTHHPWNTVTIANSNMGYYRDYYPKAVDKQHPGTSAHKKFAEDLYKKITERK